MFTASRISKKTFFAAATLGLASVLSVVAADYENPLTEAKSGFLKYDFDSYTYTTTTAYAPGQLTPGGYLDVVKAGSGDLRAYIGSSGSSLYNLHYLWYQKGASSNFGVAEYTVLRDSKTGAVVENEDNYVPSWPDGEPDGKDLLEWKSGEVRIEGGILELTGYVNAWFDFGPVFNNHFEKEGYGTANGKMAGATRVTVADGAVLDLSGNVNVNKDSTFGYMVSRNYKTVFQFLHNLQAGDYGNAQNSELRLGSSPSLHVNIHIDGWDENTRVQRVNGGYLDNSLAFGGSVGVLDGSAAVYKTGSGDFTLLNTSAGFSGELYAAGGELILAGNNSAGLGLHSFKDWNGNVVWKAKISSAYSNAESVNIAGTYRDNGSNGESRLGSAVRYKEMNAVLDAGAETTVSRHAQKEAYFTTPDAGTLVIAENQKIRNFQSYFNAGFAVAPMTSAADAVQAAGNTPVEYARNGVTAESLIATAPIIAGTGTGSKIVIPGGNYKVGASGEWELQTDAKTGEMIGGVLLIDQEEGMGGIYEGAIVGCRVTVYDRKKFDEQTSASPGTPDERLAAVKVDETGLKAALTAIYGDDSKYAELNVATDGSFALDNAVAWDVVNYYKTKTATAGSDTSGNPEASFYVDYQADAGVTGGILALDGEGDLAILLEQSNFSGINIAATRTGKTVVNISVLNALPGAVSSLGGSVSVVSTQKDTLKTKLEFATGSRLVFTTGETIRTVVRNANENQAWDSVVRGGNTILVGDIRKSVVAFENVQDGVFGNVYVERGVDLDLAGTESVFPNASSLTLWSGSTVREGDGAIAASSLTLKGEAIGTNSTYVQVFNNLTGDASSMVDLGSGVFIANITENEEDAYSGLTHGVFNGLIRGEGSVVKGGNATLTLGSNRNIYTGTTEVGSGTLNVSKANGIARSSALLLDAGTTVTMADGQTLRNLFGASGTSVTVGSVNAPGALTVGSDVAVGLGDNRPLLVNNLGTATSGTYYRDNSFARFGGNYDREGNLLDGAGSASGSSQKKATQDYLTATAKLAYSGFDASVLEQFVGVKNYDGTELLTETVYDSVLAYGKNQSGTVTVAVPGSGSGVTLTEGGLLGELSGIYQKLQTSKFYLDNIGKTNGYYNPDALLRGFFSSDAEYGNYVEANFAIPPRETEIQQAATNKSRFEKIVSEYERLSGIANTAALEKAFTSEAAVRAKFDADFGSVMNLGGTTLWESLGGKATAINTTFAEFGIALETCATLEKRLLDSSLTDAEEEALIRELEAWEKKIYDSNGLLDTIVGYYNELSGLKNVIAAKSQFSGISIAGSFAGDVTVGGTLVDQGWINELAYAGNLTVSSLTKIGDNTLTLTGTLAAQKIVVEEGTLAVKLSALPETLPGGIAVDHGANFTVNVATGEEKTFNYSVSGYGNFVKTGAGSLVLPESVLYTGTTTIEGGVLQMTLREAQVLPNGSFLAVQDDIFITGEGAGLVLAQDDDLVWSHGLTASADSAFVKKIGGGALEISGNVALTGDGIALTVSEGKLKLSGKTDVGTGALFSIEKGATLSVAELSGTNAASVAVRGSGAFDIVAEAGKTVALRGSGIEPVEPIPANGQGLTWDAFYGTVTVSGGTLSLSGESLFDYARGVVVSSGAKLAVESGSTQKLKTIAGTGELALAGTLSVENDSGIRLGWDWKSTKSYIFDEGKLFDAPTFSGKVSGNGALEISGRGLMGFTGTLESNVSVVDGGQVVLDAKNANEAQSAGKTLSVGGEATHYEDAQGRTIVGGYTASGAATNYSSGVNANIPSGAFYANSTYVPRTFTASYTDTAGNKVTVAPENVTTDASGKLIDSISRREVSLVVSEWDYADNGELSVNWTVFNAEGKVVDLSKTTDAIVWDEQAKKFVLGTYKDKNNQTQSYTGGFRWLAESENEDGSVSLVFADVSKVNSEKLTSELILSADAGTQSDGIALSSGLILFSKGGLFGKVGDGSLSVGGADLKTDKNCGGINVYEGELTLLGGEWVLGKDNAARVALGATLTVELDGSNSPDFQSVYGSGTLKLTTSEGKNVDLAIAKSNDGLAVLPTYSPDGKFFNGIMSFDGNFSVSIADVEMSAVNTSEAVTLTLSDGVTLVQTQNTEIRGDLAIKGSVTVKGASDFAGYADSSEARRLTVAPGKDKSFTIDPGSGSLTLINVGFGYAAATGVKAIIDYTSVANTFYYNWNGTESSDGIIDLRSNSIPGQGEESPQLTSLSMIMVGETDDKVRQISGADLSLELGESITGKDSVFSISNAVYSQLAYRNGTLNVGVESGILEISDWDQFTGTTANGVNIEFLSLRSNISDTAGTIKITGKNGVAARALSGDYGTLSKTISGGGNVEFSDPAGTLVTAKQNYLGFTTVSGKVHFTGAGEENHSSLFTVERGAEMQGGLKLSGRNVSATGSVSRNLSETGGAGTATLKLNLTDPRLPETVTVQVEIDGVGNISSPKIYAENALNDNYGIFVDFARENNGSGAYLPVRDGQLEIKITDKAYGTSGTGDTYSIFLPVDINAFPSKAGSTLAYSAPAIPVATKFTLESGANWIADIVDGDGLTATDVELNGVIRLDGLSSSGALGKDVKLVSADTINGISKSEIESVVRRSEFVAEALRSGIPQENIMIYTDADGNVNVRVINDDFDIDGVDYNEAVSSGFLAALSELAGGADADRGVLNADSLLPGQDKELLFALNSMTAENLAKEAEKLSPSVFASMLAMPVAAFNSDTLRIHERLNQRRYDGAEPLRETGEYEFFVLAQGDFAENKSERDTPTFDYNLYGMTAGFDWKPNYETTLGFALGYTYGDAKAHNNGGKVNMDDMRITAFASRLFGTCYVDAGVQVGMAMFDTKRHTIAGTASGDTDSLFAGTFVTVGSVYSIWQDVKDGSGLYFTPSIGLSYLHTQIDGFSERGVAGLNLDDTEGDSLRARIAASIQWEFPLETWKMRLGLEAAYTHDFLGDELDTDARFAVGGNAFSSSAKALPTDIFSLGPTVDIMVSERSSLYFGYGVEIDTDSGVSQNVNAGFRHRF